METEMETEMEMEIEMAPAAPCAKSIECAIDPIRSEPHCLAAMGCRDD